jgi:hypothetical protein
MSEYDIVDDRNLAEAEAEWDSGIEFGPGTNTYKLMRALLTESDRMDEDLEGIYDQHHVNSATGRDLGKIGDLVNVPRQTGESDARYRARIKARFRASTIDTTFDQFTEFVASVLSTNIDNIEFFTSYGARPATVDVSADSSIYDDVDLTPSDLRELLGAGVPAGHEVRVIEGGTFRLKADGDTDQPEKGLTSDSITSGGTLASDLI